MAWLHRDTRRLLLGVGIGAGSLLAAPVVGATLAAVARPLVKALLKHSILAAERSRQALALVAESLEDVVAEVRAEVEEELAPKPAQDEAASAPAEPVSRSALS
jgi:hypothetical protein